MPEKRCIYCGKLYTPYGRMAKRQKVCGAQECVAKHKRAMARRWWAARPGRRAPLNAKKRAWAVKCKYWAKYRDGHPGYTEQNRKQSRVRMKRRRELELLFRQPVAYLNSLLCAGGPMFANQELLAKTYDGAPAAPIGPFANQELLNLRLDGTLRYLVAQAMFANIRAVDVRCGVGIK